MQKILPKKELNLFLSSLMDKYELIAPLKIDNNLTKFLPIKEPKQIYLKEITRVPAKKFFLPENELISEYKNNKIITNNNKTKKRIIFGIRKCDLNALQIIDKLMFDDLYKNKRKNTIFIGLFCDNPDKYCFCNSMELNDNCYDLYLYPYKNDYYISIGSKKGEALIKNLKNAKKTIILKEKNTKFLNSKDIDRNYRNKIWETDADKCLSCSACTIYCPTCNCFDIKDHLDINLKDGKRSRAEMSCQLKSFSKVAGAKPFRDSRLVRFKHFIYHKIVYFKKKKKRYMCVGCGRCLRACPAKIDWVKTINLLETEEDIKRNIINKGGKLANKNKR